MINLYIYTYMGKEAEIVNGIPEKLPFSSLGGKVYLLASAAISDAEEIRTG